MRNTCSDFLCHVFKATKGKENACTDFWVPLRLVAFISRSHMWGSVRLSLRSQKCFIITSSLLPSPSSSPVFLLLYLPQHWSRPQTTPVSTDRVQIWGGFSFFFFFFVADFAYLFRCLELKPLDLRRCSAGAAVPWCHLPGSLRGQNRTCSHPDPDLTSDRRKEKNKINHVSLLFPKNDFPLLFKCSDLWRNIDGCLNKDTLSLRWR